MGLGGAVHGKVLENEKVVRGNQNVGKMWDSNGIRLVFGFKWHKTGVWAWCLIIRFVVLKFPNLVSKLWF